MTEKTLLATLILSVGAATFALVVIVIETTTGKVKNWLNEILPRK
jgi:hypothetical protein